MALMGHHTYDKLADSQIGHESHFLSWINCGKNVQHFARYYSEYHMMIFYVRMTALALLDTR